MNDVLIAFLSTSRLSTQSFVKVLEENNIGVFQVGTGAAIVKTSRGDAYRVSPACISKIAENDVMKAYRLACLCGVPFVVLEDSCQSRANVL